MSTRPSFAGAADPTAKTLLSNFGMVQRSGAFAGGELLAQVFASTNVIHHDRQKAGQTADLNSTASSGYSPR